jgi:hypothetical protein
MHFLFRMVWNKTLYDHASEYAIRKVPQTLNKEELELNVTHHLLIYTDDIHLFGSNINVTKKNIEALLDASMEDCLEEDMEKMKYMFTCCH